jgi:hypothetical protein
MKKLLFLSLVFILLSLFAFSDSFDDFEFGSSTSQDIINKYGEPFYGEADEFLNIEYYFYMTEFFGYSSLYKDVGLCFIFKDTILVAGVYYVTDEDRSQKSLYDLFILASNLYGDILLDYSTEDYLVWKDNDTYIVIQYFNTEQIAYTMLAYFYSPFFLSSIVGNL